MPTKRLILSFEGVGSFREEGGVGMSGFESITVLTTEERADWYKAVFGNGADYVFNPVRTDPLGQYLTNLRIAHGSIAVLDEGHFITPLVLSRGVKAFVDSESGMGGLRLILVCSGRKPGDRLLAFLTTYCGLYDIVCATEPIEIMSALEQLVRKPNDRFNALPYMRSLACLYEGEEEFAREGRFENKATGEGAYEVRAPAGSTIKITIETSAA